MAGCAGCPRHRAISPAEVAVLAIGHSARDTYGMLLRRGVPLEAKPFQLGVRIEQPQAAIDRGALRRELPATRARRRRIQRVGRTAGTRDLFTFCMCAGGYVMPSVSEPGYFLHQRHEREPPRLAVRQ